MNPAPCSRRRHGSRRIAGALICGVLLALGCGRAERDAPLGKGVLVIAIDAWRRDHLSLYGYDRGTSPFLEQELAQQSVVFDDAWSPCAGLQAAHVALLTGCDPRVALVPPFTLPSGEQLHPQNPWKLPTEVPHLALEFAAQGYRTAAFVDHRALGEMDGLSRGFHDVHAVGGARGSDAPVFGFEGVGSRFFAWTRGLDASRDWFAYMHMADLERMWTHDELDFARGMVPRAYLDFVPPAAPVGPVFHAVSPARALGVQPSLGDYDAFYDSSLSELDRNLKRLWGHLEKSGLLERTTVVICGTYGFGFGEAGLFVDAGTLSEVDLRVPLIVRPAPELKIEVPQRVADLVSLSDLAPTLLQLSGADPISGMHGVSFNAALRGTGPGSREHVHAIAALHAGFAVVDSEWMYIFGEPGRGGGRSLAESFYGWRPAHPEPVEALLPRSKARRRKPLDDGLFGALADSERASELRLIGEQYCSDMDDLREVLHLGQWDSRAREPQVLQRLRDQGLLSD